MKSIWIKRFDLLVAICFLHITLSESHAVTCDIISAVTVKIIKITTTTNSAAVTWNDGHTNGNRYFCYGTTPPKTCPIPAASRKTGQVEQINNLAPLTKYYYRFYGTYGSKTSNTIGAFTTDNSSCMEVTKNIIIGQVADGSGTPLEHVVVTLSKTAGGEPIEIDTSLSTGGFTIRIGTPGAFFLNYAYPTAPSVVSVPVTLQDKTLWNGTKLLTGLFQAGGTVVVPPKDSVRGAVVILKNTADPSQSFTTTTDFDGHYNFPVKPGSYTVTANYNGNTLPAPINVTVTTSSVKIPVMVLSGTTGTLQKTKRIAKDFKNLNPKVKGYRIDGVRFKPNPGKG